MTGIYNVTGEYSLIWMYSGYNVTGEKNFVMDL